MLAAAEIVADGVSTLVDGLRGGLLAFGVEDDEATGAFAGGGGGQAGAFEGEVEQAALAGGHRGEGVGLLGGADLGDGCLSGAAELLVAVGFESAGVDGDAVVFFGLEAEDLGGDVLDGVEQLAVAVDEERGVGAGEFDGELRWGEASALGLRCGCRSSDRELELQMPAGGEQTQKVLD